MQKRATARAFGCNQDKKQQEYKRDERPLAPSVVERATGSAFLSLVSLAERRRRLSHYPREDRDRRAAAGEADALSRST
jgi:hypothetical protein